jgi:hypothetical protein
MLCSAEKMMGYDKESPPDGAVGGWRHLLPLVGWVALSVAVGTVSWAGLNALAPGWGGIDGRVLVVAEVCVALVVALLLAYVAVE